MKAPPSKATNLLWRVQKLKYDCTIPTSEKTKDKECRSQFQQSCLRVTFAGSGTIYLGGSLLFRFSFLLQLVAVGTFWCRTGTCTAHAEKIGRIFASSFVKTVFSILFFKVSVRTWRLWRCIVVIKIRFFNDLIYIIQNHFGMNFLWQVISIYVEQI